MTYYMERIGRGYSRRPSASRLVKVLDVGHATQEERAMALPLLAQAEEHDREHDRAAPPKGDTSAEAAK